MSREVLLTGGTLIDGTGAPAVVADLRLVDGVVAELLPHGATALVSKNDSDSAVEVIDVNGLCVAPGFIDVHTHSDLSLLAEPDGASKVLQGVTTEVVGNCSFSAFPSAPPATAALNDHLSRLGGPAVTAAWATFDDYATAVAKAAPRLNVAAFVGHGALRIAAMSDPYGTASTEDIERMKELLDAALTSGALGLSTGLTHTPSSHATEAEIHALARICAAHGGIYATHSRATAHNEYGAIHEAIRVSESTGVRLQFSHIALNNPENWGRASEVLEIFRRATDAGLPVGFDVYPYTASSSALLQYLPEWVQHGGGAGIRAANADPAWRNQALADARLGWFGGIAWHWDRIVISDLPPSATEAAARELIGRSLEDIAHTRGVEPVVALLDLCVQYGSAVQAVLHYRVESDIQEFIADPLGIVASDGLAMPLYGTTGKPHPRSFGTFPRLLGRYVREHGTLSLTSAVQKITSEPAARLGIPGRGSLRPGAIADIVVFDPASVADTATFESPIQAPIGIERVYVAGQLIAAGGELVGQGNTGKLLHRA